MILRLWTRYKKPASDKSKGVRRLCCRLMLRGARLLIVIKRTVRMVPSFPHDMRDLFMPGCHHPRKKHFEKMTMMSTAAPSMGMRSPQTTRVSLMASDRKNQRGLPPLKRKEAAKIVTASRQHNRLQSSMRYSNECSSRGRWTDSSRAPYVSGR